MESGFYAACAGFKAQSEALDLIANNLANLNTTGYRGQEPTFHSLLAVGEAGAHDPLNRVINDFNVLGGTQLDLGSGSLERTGSPLDLAIEGKGFFAVQAQGETLYTRNGGFHVSPAGQLVTAEGNVVLGDQGGAISLPEGAVSISPDGTISVNGAVAGKVKVVEFATSSRVMPAGNSGYSAPASEVRPSPESAVRQGMLESSNVNTAGAVVRLMTVQRHADMMARALSIFYGEFDNIATSDLPKV